MPIKTVLSVVGVDQSDRDLDVAAALCREAGAHLSVLVIALAPPPPMGEYAAMASDIWAREREADAGRLQDRAAAVTRWLLTADVAADVTTEYPEAAWASDAVGRRARYADLTVVGPDMLSDGRLKAEVVEGALFSSGRPLLLVPAGSSPTLKPRRVSIAWDSGVEAARAADAALPLLTAAQAVRLVLVNPTEGADAQGAEPGADAAAWLARHGAQVTVDRLPDGGRAVADILTRHAIDTAANLLVMGAYGHSRLRERIFGGVTHSIIDNPPLPVLLAR